jgi:hypothetical protein
MHTRLETTLRRCVFHDALGGTVRLTAILIVVSLWTATGIAQSPRADFVLDLLTYQHAPDPAVAPVLSSGSGGGTSDGVRRPDPIRFTLVTLERTRFVWGDSVVYEVLIENIGNRPLTLPWSSDLSAAGPSEQTHGRRTGAVSLEVRRRNGSPFPDASLELQSLFGTRTEPRTLQTLAPRRTALIRVPGWWNASATGVAAVMRQEQAATVQVTAVLDLFDEHLQVHSANSIEVLVERRPAP